MRAAPRATPQRRSQKAAAQRISEEAARALRGRPDRGERRAARRQRRRQRPSLPQEAQRNVARRQPASCNAARVYGEAAAPAASREGTAAAGAAGAQQQRHVHEEGDASRRSGAVTAASSASASTAAPRRAPRAVREGRVAICRWSWHRSPAVASRVFIATIRGSGDRSTVRRPPFQTRYRIRISLQGSRHAARRSDGMLDRAPARSS